jgi:N,N'-diacetylchitobiose phosphorylase
MTITTMQLTGQQIRQLYPLAWKLSNARWQTWITAAGTGFSQVGEIQISRWRGDVTKDVDAFYVFLRDVDRGTIWSPTLQPFCGRSLDSQRDSHVFLPNQIAFRCEQDGLLTEMSVRVPLQWPMELRRIRLTNFTDRPRRIELLPYLELVLQSRREFESHPTFSKMFIGTHWDPEGQALWAQRRPRSPEETTLSAALFFVGPSVQPLTGLNMETCRATFLGRGRSVFNAKELFKPEPKEGRVGGVLDPIFNFRVPVLVGPGKTCDHFFGLAAAHDPEELVALARTFQKSPELCGQVMQSVPFFDELVQPAKDIITAHSEHATLEAANLHATTVFGIDVPTLPPSTLSLFPAAENHLSKLVSGSSDENASGPLRYHGNQTEMSPRVDLSDGVRHEAAELAGLQFENRWGGFSADGMQYHMRLRNEVSTDRGMVLPPMPWTHIIANDQVGAIVSERGSVSTWYGNSRECRLTPWYNDPICDPHGEAFYLQDLDTGLAWSPTPGPLPNPIAEYEVAYHFGKIEFRHTVDGLSQAMELFVPESDPVKITRWRIQNDSSRMRRVRTWGYLEWILGNGVVMPHEPLRVSRSHNVILAEGNPSQDPSSAIVAFSAWLAPSQKTKLLATTERVNFIGRYGTMEWPSVLSQPLSHRQPAQGSEGDLVTSERPPSWNDSQPCAAFEQDFVLEPGETVEIVALLGGTTQVDKALGLVQKYSDSRSRSASLRNIESGWKARCQKLVVSSPSQPLNVMLNGWLMYQNVTCRLRGRSSYYQGGGAVGFRDQLQDSLALIHTDPELTRAQILLHAAHQFVEGDVLHWWHPPNSRGVRTRFSDDLHWLPYAALEYVDITGDDSIWDEEVRFLVGDRLDSHEQERFLWPKASNEVGTLWEHCRRALRRATPLGKHNLPLMGCGDWNDGMSRVGAGGQGESVWLAFFLAPILDRFSDVCSRRGELHAESDFRDLRSTFVASVEEHAWDGRWYRRAFLDNGVPIGSHANSECRIDALVQAWAALSQIAPKEKVLQALAEVEAQLVDRENGIIRLLTPPFQSDQYDVGYIRGYIPGVRENGGQYTHGVLWFIRALAEAGQGTKAWQLLEMMTPIWHTRDAAAIAIYKTEPYVIAADIYGSPPHVGRGGWTWYTGSAGWMYRVAIETLLGIRMWRGKHLRINPRVPRDWQELRVAYRIPGLPATTYHIEIHNPCGNEMGIRQVFVDGVACAPAPETEGAHGVLIPIDRERAEHHVRVVMD